MLAASTGNPHLHTSSVFSASSVFSTGSRRMANTIRVVRVGCCNKKNALASRGNRLATA